MSLDAATLNAKLEAVGEYRTQLAQLVRYFGDFLNTDGLGRERFWRAVGSLRVAWARLGCGHG